MTELFVYWRCPRAQAAEALAAMSRMQAGLQQAHPGLLARRYQRADDDAALTTLMETYAGLSVEPSLQAAIEAAATEALSPWCVDRRHAEVFIAR